jgi:DNA-binding beta-propeller fold protein YncE
MAKARSISVIAVTAATIIAFPAPSALASWAPRAGAAIVPATAVGATGTLVVGSAQLDAGGGTTGPGTVTAISTANNSVTRAVKVGTDPVAVAVTPSGRTAYVAGVGSDEDGSPGTFMPVDLASGVAGKPVAMGTDPVAVVLAPNGKTVYVVCSYDAATQAPTGSVRPVSTTTGSVGNAITVAAGPTAAAIAPSGLSLFVVGEHSAAEVLTSSGTVRPIRVQATAVAITPNSHTAYFVGAVGTGGLEVVAVSTATGHIEKEVGTGASVPQGLAISPNGHSVYVVGTPDPGLKATEDTVTIISTATDHVSKTVDLGVHPSAQAWDVAVSPNGKTVYALGYGSSKQQGLAIPINTATGDAGKAVPVGYNASAIVFSPNSQWAYVLADGIATGGVAKSASAVVPIDVATGAAGSPISVASYAQVIAGS